MKEELDYGILYLPSNDNGSGTKIVMPNSMKRIIDYYQSKEEQPTCREAAKELGITAATILNHMKRFEELGLCKRDRRGTIKWTLEDL